MRWGGVRGRGGDGWGGVWLGRVGSVGSAVGSVGSGGWWLARRDLFSDPFRVFVFPFLCRWVQRDSSSRVRQLPDQRVEDRGHGLRSLSADRVGRWVASYPDSPRLDATGKLNSLRSTSVLFAPCTYNHHLLTRRLHHFLTFRIHHLLLHRIHRLDPLD